ncbi:MAG: formate/nitrite transporter family protein [Lachnospiraceae bacterium]|nr:formate/nitrite transporter family protein [Lachnospiraceae bacterium]
MVEKFTEACVNKTKQSVLQTFVLAILAGMFIAFGANSSNLAVHAIDNLGVAKVVAGVIFPVGLMLIVAVAGELFTGDCMLIFGNYAGRYSAAKTIEKLVTVFLGNLVGGVLIAALVSAAGQFNMGNAAVGAYTIKVAFGKLQYSFAQCVASGILCNIIVCLAVLMASRCTDVPGKVIAVFLPICAFVIGSFEHCVANMYYIPAGMMAASNPACAAKAAELYGYTDEMLASVNVVNFLTKNLVGVTIGNIIGGMIFVALPLFYLEMKAGKK